jgi:hypothetical protein
VGWLLDASPQAIRTRIRRGDVKGVRLPGGFRVPRAEALRLARERIESESGRKVSDRALERLVDEVIATNKARS